MIKNNKRGISTIIATVLIVLITVAAVTILWAAVSPLIDQSADLSCFEVASAVKVDTSAAYTNAEGSTNADTLNIRVERAANSEALKGFEIIVDVEGETLVSDGFLVDNSESETGDDLPTQNGAKVYTFIDGGTAGDVDATSNNLQLGRIILATAIQSGETVKVSIAPQVEIDGEITTCDAGSFVEIANNVV